MEAETKPVNKKEQEDWLKTLRGAKEMIKLYGELIEEITVLVRAAAEVHMDVVDSQILLNILQRHILEYQHLARSMK